MLLHLVDTNPLVIEAWHKEFHKCENVTVQEADIIEVAETCIVSPANSYGYMDGGIDLIYTEYFGPSLQLRLQQQITEAHNGLLPVGSALILKTGDKRIPYMISAPTMEFPHSIPSSNVFFSMSSILKIALKNKTLIDKIFCPGLGTGVGHVDPFDAAREMRKAYNKIFENN